MDNVFKKFKKSGTYHRKLKLASEKYRLMYRKLHFELKTMRNSAAKIVSDPTIDSIPDRGPRGNSEPLAPCQMDTNNCVPPYTSTGGVCIKLVQENSVLETTIPETFGQAHLNGTGPVDRSNSVVSEQQNNLVNPQSEAMNSAMESSREAIRSWSLRHNIPHNALKDLLMLLKDKYNDTSLPMDPRTLLETPQSIGKLCNEIPGGKYWHHGLSACLEKWFENLSNDINISLNINIDGLPVYKSSKFQLWPILCNVHEMPDLKPMPIGIYLGKTKPTDIIQYLTPFVNEAIPLIQNGFSFKGHIISIKIRCFICDSPARAFVKGVVNFNGKNGCLKCTIDGEYSHVSRTVVFPMLHCPLRTDLKFRQKQYGKHHAGQDSPILKLPEFDMVKDFVVADSLHLLELGVMKRLLTGWRDGSLGYAGKLSALKIQQLSDSIINVKLPKEIHRQMRGLDCLTFWKGTEWRSLLNYIGIVVFKDIIDEQLYNHFLLLFIAVRICSSEYFKKWLSLAQILFEKFIEGFLDIYGEEFVTSNIHNLEHVVSDVERFGSLSSISAYPFENYLFQLKKCVRQGKYCLEQVANRILEKNQLPNDNTTRFIPRIIKRGNSVHCELRQGLEINNVFKDSWFLTKNLEIVQMVDASVDSDSNILIHGIALTNPTDFFMLPIRSSFLYIYAALISNLKNIQTFSIDDIICKFVSIPYKLNTFVFVPLLHTFLH